MVCVNVYDNHFVCITGKKLLYLTFPSVCPQFITSMHARIFAKKSTKENHYTLGWFIIIVNILYLVALAICRAIQVVIVAAVLFLVSLTASLRLSDFQTH